MPKVILSNTLGSMPTWTMCIGGMGENISLHSSTVSLRPCCQTLSNSPTWNGDLTATLNGGGTQEAIPVGRPVTGTGHGTEDVPCQSVASHKQESSRNPSNGETLDPQEELIVLRLPFECPFRNAAQRSPDLTVDAELDGGL